MIIYCIPFLRCSHVNEADTTPEERLVLADAGKTTDQPKTLARARYLYFTKIIPNNNLPLGNIVFQ